MDPTHTRVTIMRKINLFLTLVFVSALLGLVACENKAAKEAEAARIEQEKNEAIQKALEEQKAEFQRQEQQAEEARIQQQAEQEKKVQEDQQNNIKKFVGKYYFRRYPISNVEHNYTFVYEVLPDGRVIYGNDEYIGTIRTVSDDAFMIRPSHRLHHFPQIQFCVYKDGEGDHEVGHVKGGDYIDIIVFDVKENRAYRSGLEDYRNRDVGRLEYYKFTR